jgi:hypothetical protein
MSWPWAASFRLWTRPRPWARSSNTPPMGKRQSCCRRILHAARSGLQPAADHQPLAHMRWDSHERLPSWPTVEGNRSVRGRANSCCNLAAFF